MRIAIALMLLPSVALAQPERYELGQRLKAFEAAWEKTPDPAARKRALAVLPKLTQQFFSARLDEAGRTLDQARFALASADEPDAATKWLTSLWVKPEKWLFDAKQKEMTVTIGQFYKCPGDVDFRLSCGFPGAERVIVNVKVLPCTIRLTLPILSQDKMYGENESYLQLDFVSSTGQIVHREIVISQLDLSRVQSMDRLLEKSKDAITPLRKATKDYLLEHFECWEHGESPEMDPHLSDRLSQFMGDIGARDRIIMQRESGKGYSSYYKPYETVMSVPIGKKNTFPVRVYLPTRESRISSRKYLIPVVVAMHGAGGSENLFFEGYGAGHIVKECESRGMILIAPRVTISFSGKPIPLKTILETLRQELPIDMKEVYLLGHSMGAMQAAALVQHDPKAYKAVALLGGAGTITDAKSFAEIPTFIGIGDKDFMLPSVKSFAKKLKAADAKNVTYKEYPDFEHLVIVREALPDVFKSWDEILKNRRKRILN